MRLTRSGNRNYLGLSTLALEPKVAMPRARAAVERALELDPDLAEAYSSRAAVKAFYDWNWKDAEQDFRVAIEKAPGSAQPHLDYGYMLVVLGRFDEASRELARAHALDPLSSFISSVQLWPLYEGRKYDEAIRAAQEVISVDSTAWNAHQVMGQACLAKGEFAQAYAAELKALRARGGGDTGTAFASTYAAMGRRDLARRKLEVIMRHGPPPDSYGIGLVYGMLGDKDRAFELLGREADRRSEAIIFLKVDPEADSVRSDPRFAQLLRRMNLE